MTGTIEFTDSVGQEAKRGEARWTKFSRGPAYKQESGVEPAGKAYQCRVVFVAEEEGFSAHALNLPGAVSQGETIEEALANIVEACQGVLKEYLSTGHIPWSVVEVEGKVVGERWVLVNV
jgi:predicted RNase H-like HicB family nuclease